MLPALQHGSQESCWAPSSCSPVVSKAHTHTQHSPAPAVSHSFPLGAQHHSWHKTHKPHSQLHPTALDLLQSNPTAKEIPLQADQGTQHKRLQMNKLPQLPSWLNSRTLHGSRQCLLPQEQPSCAALHISHGHGTASICSSSGSKLCTSTDSTAFHPYIFKSSSQVRTSALVCSQGST